MSKAATNDGWATLCDAVSPTTNKFHREPSPPLHEGKPRYLTRAARAAIRIAHKRFPDLGDNELAKAFSSNPAAIEKVRNNIYCQKRDKISEDNKFCPRSLMARMTFWMEATHRGPKVPKTPSCRSPSIAIRGADPDDDYEEETSDDDEEESIRRVTQEEEAPRTRSKTSTPKKMPPASATQVLEASPKRKSNEMETSATQPVKKKRKRSKDKKKDRHTVPAQGPKLIDEDDQVNRVKAFFKAAGYSPKKVIQPLIDSGLGPDEVMALKSLDLKRVAERLEYCVPKAIRKEQGPVKMSLLADAIVRARDADWDILMGQEDDDWF